MKSHIHHVPIRSANASKDSHFVAAIGVPPDTPKEEEPMGNG